MENILTKIFSNESDKLKKFERISKYFDNLNENDIITQNIFDYISFAKPEDKGLMDLFIRKHLVPHLDNFEFSDSDNNINFSNFSSNNYSSTTITKIYHDYKLNGHSRIASTSRIFNTNDLISIKDLVDLKCDLDKVSLIDLSNNNLNSKDITFIYELIENLNKQGKLKDTIVLLKNNRIHGIQGMESIVRTYLMKILEINDIKYVDLRDNPFCSIDQKSFFMKINIYESNIILNKLIWIDRWDLNSSWPKSVLQSDEILEYVKNTHMKYYSLK